MIVAHVEQIWRYPVKSMGGEMLASTWLVREGMPGDRCWAVVDAARREIRSAKQWPMLLDLAATLVAGREPHGFVYGEAVPDAEIRLPDGRRLRARDDGSGAALGAWLGRAAHLAPLAPASDDAHYRLAAPRTAASMAAELQLLPGEPLPDYADIAADTMAALAQNATPPGSHADAFPLHLLSAGSLALLRERAGVDTAVQRFRPNILLRAAADGAGAIEDGWIGRCVAIGEARLRVDSRTVRCAMPARPQAWCGLAAEPRLTRALVEHCGRRLGVNVRVEREGRVAVGDAVRLLHDRGIGNPPQSEGNGT